MAGLRHGRPQALSQWSIDGLSMRQASAGDFGRGIPVVTLDGSDGGVTGRIRKVMSRNNGDCLMNSGIEEIAAHSQGAT